MLTYAQFDTLSQLKEVTDPVSIATMRQKTAKRPCFIFPDGQIRSGRDQTHDHVLLALWPDIPADDVFPRVFAAKVMRIAQPWGANRDATTLITECGKGMMTDAQAKTLIDGALLNDYESVGVAIVDMTTHRNVGYTSVQMADDPRPQDLIRRTNTNAISEDTAPISHN